MSYRGFTWNMTASEAANLSRILSEFLRREDVHKWDRIIAEHLRAKATIFLELTPDGTSPAHARSDA